MLRPSIAAAMLLAMSTPVALLAQTPTDPSVAAATPGVAPADTLATRAATLSPGAYAWADDSAAASRAPVRVLVSVPRQLAFVYRDGALIGVSTVSTGKPGHDTPLGSFPILQKAQMHRSNLYDDAPMPFMQRLTWDGVALHAGNIPGYPASHGCVRLPAAFAKQLFALTRLGAVVTITDDPAAGEPAPAPAPAPLPVTDIASGEPAAEPIAQTVAPSMPLSPGVQLASLPVR